MTNAEIAAAFDQVADLLEFKGENPFRVRAYRNAARTIGDLPRQVTEILDEPGAKLTEIAGIGKDLAEKIQALVDTRKLPMLEELLAEIPETVLALLRIPGLGPKRAAILYHELDVKTLDQLRQACESHRVQELKGFGPKMEATILDGIGIASEAGKRFLWAEADQFAQDILAHMRPLKAVAQIEVAGSYRRKKETVGDLDFLVVADDAAAVMDHFAGYPGREQTLARGGTKMTIRLTNGCQVDLRVVTAESFGAALQYFTGSQAHNIVLRGLAKDRKMKINEYGVYRGEKRIAGRTEEEVYGTLDLPCFPPEIREARFEFQWAEKGPLPELLTLDDIRGDLHMHSTWSDGLATLDEMVEAAKRRGLKYIAITDHSKRTMMAGGLDEKRLREQWAEIDQYNTHHRGITVLKGVEMDILEQGGLDLGDDVLAEADWVVASIHFGQRQSRERITERIINALKNPYVCAIAHPTGRLLTRRKPYEVDLEAVLRAAREHGKCMELNAHPSRLDLDDVACTMARNFGVPVVISTDAHSIDGLEAMRYGVQQARRGGLTAADVANTQSWVQLKKRIGRT
jgi:DNA polymerase (family 10)